MLGHWRVLPASDEDSGWGQKRLGRVSRFDKSIENPIKFEFITF